MKRVTSALLLGLPLLALAVVAYADCGGSHTTASSEQIAQPAPPPPPPSPHG